MPIGLPVLKDCYIPIGFSIYWLIVPDEDKFEDTKGISGSHQSERIREYNGEMKKGKRTNDDL
jgi:hypothetical protein